MSTDAIAHVAVIDGAPSPQLTPGPASRPWPRPGAGPGPGPGPGHPPGRPAGPRAGAGPRGPAGTAQHSAPEPSRESAPARRGRARAALALLALVLIAAWPLLGDVTTRPIRAVLVAGEFHQLSRAALERAVADEVGDAGFLAVDVDAVRRAALALPWVRDATVRRVWPDRLQIAVVERGAVARWNEAGLLEEDGALFAPGNLEGLGGLVALAGPDGRHAEVLDRLRELEAALAGSGLAPIERLELEARGTWRLTLAGGTTVVLGHGQGARALARFARAAAALGEAHPAGFERADLRYSNGFAVRWRAVDGSGEDAQGRSADEGAGDG